MVTRVLVYLRETRRQPYACISDLGLLASLWRFILLNPISDYWSVIILVLIKKIEGLLRKY